MMFKKYINKISNTIGTVNYLSQKTKDNHLRRSSKYHQNFYDDGYDCCDIDPSTIQHMDIDLSINGSRKNSMVDDYSDNEQIILSEAVAKLRIMLFIYPLVFSFIIFYYCFPFF